MRDKIRMHTSKREINNEALLNRRGPSFVTITLGHDKRLQELFSIIQGHSSIF